ncbi:MAG: hypothetical protein U0N82_02470 [Oscillospiraceae bacterium]
MSKQINDKMSFFKKVFCVLAVLDVIALISAAINVLPTFQQKAEFGQPMAGIFSVMFAGMVAIKLFEVLAKIFLMKSTSSDFSWESGEKRCMTAMKLLVLFNVGAVIINLLAAGGEGATLLNQANLYLTVLASAAEVIAVSAYLRTVKKR